MLYFYPYIKKKKSQLYFACIFVLSSFSELVLQAQLAALSSVLILVCELPERVASSCSPIAKE